MTVCCAVRHIYYIRALTLQRNLLIHVHVLGVATVVHIDRLASSRVIDCRLYPRGACIERAAVAPPACFVDIDVTGNCCRCQSRQDAERKYYCNEQDRCALPFPHDWTFACFYHTPTPVCSRTVRNWCYICYHSILSITIPEFHKSSLTPIIIMIII